MENLKLVLLYYSTMPKTVVLLEVMFSNPAVSESNESAEVLAKVMSDVVDLLESGGALSSHGNGPQVGHLMQLDENLSHTMDEWVSATQGMIGHSLAINLDSILLKRRCPERTASIITRVEVDPEDAGFKLPTKPVGPILSDRVVMSVDWDIAETINVLSGSCQSNANERTRYRL